MPFCAIFATWFFKIFSQPFYCIYVFSKSVQVCSSLKDISPKDSLQVPNNFPGSFLQSPILKVPNTIIYHSYANKTIYLPPDSWLQQLLFGWVFFQPHHCTKTETCEDVFVWYEPTMLPETVSKINIYSLVIVIINFSLQTRWGN